MQLVHATAAGTLPGRVVLVTPPGAVTDILPPRLAQLGQHMFHEQHPAMLIVHDPADPLLHPGEAVGLPCLPCLPLDSTLILRSSTNTERKDTVSYHL